MSNNPDDSLSNSEQSQDDSTWLTNKMPDAEKDDIETAHIDDQRGYQALPGDPERQQTVISSKPGELPTGGQTPGGIVGEALVGTDLEHFTLEEFVGKGGMGAVFRAIDRKLDRTVAVKVLSRNRTDNESLRRFSKEAQSAARLDHPNIARVYYVGEDRGWHFIVFEYINGVNIRDLVEHKGPLQLDEAWSYVLQITDALVHASERDVVHRDIKPSNILVTSAGNAKLVDMGLARLDQVENEDSDVTASGVTLGTFDYISPEQARDPRSTDVRSDIYSLGCTLYFMLTGIPPYPTGTVLQKLLSHSSDPPPNPLIYRNDLDDGSVKILHKMLAKRPENRYQRPADIITDVVRLSNQLGLTVNLDGRNWAALDSSKPFQWLNQVNWIVPLLCLITAWFVINRIGTTEAELVIALPTFRAAPYDLPIRVPDAGVDMRPTSNKPSKEQVPKSYGPEGAVIDSGEQEQTSDYQTVIVGEPLNSLPDNMVAVDSLERALGLLKLDPDISVIEVWDDQTINSDNFDLELGQDRGQHLTIRGKPGFIPAITLQITKNALEANNTEFVRITGGNLSFQGLELRFELPLEVRQSCSLFALDNMIDFDFDDSIITVIPPVADGIDSQAFASVFRMISGPTEPMLSADADDSVAIDMTFNNAIVRGPVTLVSNPRQTAFRFHWNNGLFISNTWLYKQSLDAESFAPIQVSFANVTMYCGAGVISLKDDSTVKSTVVKVNMQDSIVVTAVGKPLILLEQPEISKPIPFVFVGNNLAIDNTVVVLEQRTQAELDATQQLTLSELLQRQEEGTRLPWFNLTEVSTAVVWEQAQVPSQNKPIFQQDISDYLLDNSELFSGGVLRSGFEKSE